MFTSFSAERFRQFQKVELNDLSRVNVITGPNGAGKTSLLEGLFLISGAYRPELALALNGFRGAEGATVEYGSASARLFRPLFRDLEPGKGARLVATLNGRRLSMELTVPAESEQLALQEFDKVGASTGETEFGVLHLKTQFGNESRFESTLMLSPKGIKATQLRPPAVPAVFLYSGVERNQQELASRYGQVAIAKKEEQLLDALRLVEPRLQGLVSVVEGPGRAATYVDVGQSELVPAWLLGGGFLHVAQIVLSMLEQPGRLILIDEIENGIYYRWLAGVWRVLAKVARDTDSQVVATTHSRECVAAAYEALAMDDPYELGVHRVESRKGHSHVVSYGREELETSLAAGFEVR